jgi:hypothetical protein
MISVLLEAEFIPRGQPDELTAIQDTCSKNTILTMQIQPSSVSVLCTVVGHQGRKDYGKQ